MDRFLRDVVIGLLLGTFLMLAAPARAALEPADPTHNHDPYWYDFNDPAIGCNWSCYSYSSLDDRMSDALNNPSAPWGQLGWSEVTTADAVYWSHSSGNGSCHAPGLGSNCGHHRANMVTFDYDCAVSWANPVENFPHHLHPQPNATCDNHGNAITAFAYRSVFYHYAAAYGIHGSLIDGHIYLKPLWAKPWGFGTGTIGSTTLDVWATIEHEFGHSLGHLGHWSESDNAYCPDDPQSSARLTMCANVPTGYWKQRTPEAKDKTAMDFSYPD